MNELNKSISFGEPKSASEWDIRLERLLAEIPSDTRVVCFSSPDGTNCETLAEQWLRRDSEREIRVIEGEAVEHFVSAPSIIERAGTDSPEKVGLILRVDQLIDETSDYEKFLDETSPIPVAIISTISHNISDALFRREDTEILHPESLFYTFGELTELCDDQWDVHTMWQATGGWPRAVELFMERVRDADRRGLTLLRRMAMDLEKWLSGSHPDMRRMSRHLTSLPKFNSSVLDYLLRSHEIDFDPLNYVASLGLLVRVKTDESVASGWWKIPNLMVEGLNFRFDSNGSHDNIHIAGEALHALAETGEWKSALIHGLENNQWKVFQEILEQHWGVAVVQDADGLLSLLKRFLRIRGDLTIGEHSIYAYAALFINSAIEFYDQSDDGQRRAIPSFSGRRRALGLEPKPALLASSVQQSPWILLLQMMTLRVEGYWAHAAERAEQLTRALRQSQQEASFSTSKEQIKRAFAWQQVGLTQLLQMSFGSAIEGFRYARQIASTTGHSRLREKCASYLVVIENFRRTFEETAHSTDQEKSVAADIKPSDDVPPIVRENMSLAEGFNALWSLDTHRIQQALEEDPESFEGHELWPFRYFLATKQKIYFGNRSHGIERIEEQKPLAAAEPKSLLAWMLKRLEASVFLLEGKSAQLQQLVESSGTGDPYGILPAQKAVAYASIGEYERALRFVHHLKGSTVRAAADNTIAAIEAYCELMIEGATNIDLSQHVDPDQSLYRALTLWSLGLSEKDMAQLYKLNDEQLEILRLIERNPVTSRHKISPLSEREIQVLQHLTLGSTRKEIAEQLHLSLNTVKSHVHSIYKKLGVSQRAEAIDRALKLGYL